MTAHAHCCLKAFLFGGFVLPKVESVCCRKIANVFYHGLCFIISKLNSDLREDINSTTVKKSDISTLHNYLSFSLEISLYTADLFLSPAANVASYDGDR